MPTSGFNIDKIMKDFLHSDPKRWPEVIVSALREEGFEVAFNVDGYRDEEDALEEGEDESKVEIKIKSKQDGRWMLLEDFLATEADRSRHEFVRTNVMSLTRIFNQRVKAFLREIVLAKDSPMPVYRYSYKTEFQNRGAPHVHGVLWLNLGKLEKQEKFRGAKAAFIKLRKGTPLSPADREVVCRMVDEFTTVSLCPAEVGADVVKKVKDVNTHHHTKKACRKENRPGCR